MCVQCGVLALLDSTVFVADHAIGRGSMGVVWRGRHRPSGQAVALKWLHAQAHRIADLEREARMMARLDHPHLLPVYDVGRLADAPTGLADRPCLVMAFANGGSLAAYRGRLSWPTCRAVLRQVLAGLAHLGARGLVHQDLKPANLLLDRHEGAVRVMLADLGVGRLDGAGPIAGTPAFSAPERDGIVGPWTDLYALGRTAHALLAGAPDLPIPAAVPLAVQRWIARLVHPDPAQRPQSAAEAEQLLDQVDPARGAITLPVAAAEVVVDGSTVPVQGAVAMRTAIPVEPLPRRPVQAPETWGRPTPPRPPTLWQGIALWRMRRPPLVGRLALRDRLWAAFSAAARGAPAATLLAGRPGVGTSRLLAWAAETAHARAGATIIDATAPFAAVHQRLAPQRSPLDTTLSWGAQIDALIGAAQAAGPTVWLVDGHATPLAFRLLRAVLQSAAPAWVLVGARPARIDGLRRDLEAPDALELSVPPLSAADLVHLLRQRVRIASRLAERIAIQTPGAPGLAVAVLDGLLPDLIETPVGLDLPGTVHLPSEATEVWQRAIDAVWRDASVPERESLIALAVLAPVAIDTWRALCDGMAVPVAEGLLSAFVNADLLASDPTDGRLRFAHAGVRAALLAHDPEFAVRAHQHALALRTAPLSIERVQHALGGQRPAIALDALRQLAEADIDTDLLPRLLPLIEQCRAAGVTAPGLDVLEARIALTLGERDRADACLCRVEAISALRPRLRMFMLETRGRLHLVLGAYAECDALTSEMYAAAGDDPVLYYRAQVAHARSATIGGRDAEAVEALLARPPMPEVPPGLRLRGELMLIGALKSCDRVAEGFARLDRLFAAAEAAQEPGMWPHVYCYAGDLYMGRGDADRGDIAEARRHFERAVASSDDRMPVAAYFHLNVIIADLRAGQAQDALRRLASLHGRCDPWPLRIQQLMDALWLQAAAMAGESARFDGLLERLSTVIDASASPDTRSALRAALAHLPSPHRERLDSILARLD